VREPVDDPLNHLQMALLIRSHPCLQRILCSLLQISLGGKARNLRWSMELAGFDVRLGDLLPYEDEIRSATGWPAVPNRPESALISQ